VTSPVLLLLASAASDLDPQALADAIRLHVVDLGMSVDVATEDDPGASLPTRLQAATSRMQGAGARMAVFYDSAAGDREAVLWVVRRSEQGDEAIVTVIRLPDEQGPSLYRSFALRVRDLVEGTLLLEEPRHEPRPIAAPRTPWAVGVGWDASYPPALRRLQHGPVVALQRHLGSALLAHGGLDLHLPLDRDLLAGSADLTTVGASLGLRAAARWGRISLAGGVFARALLLRATGETPDDSGEVTRAIPGTGVDVVARYRIADNVEIGLRPHVEWLLVRQRFSLAGEPAFDLGRLLTGVDATVMIPIGWGH